MNDELANEPGALYQTNGRCRFSVWAPARNAAAVCIGNRMIDMKKDEFGYFTAEANDIQPGSTYTYRLDDGDTFPDPASHYQPEGVHGPSVIIDHAEFQWHDEAWKGMPFRDLVLYEIHVGTFTAEGTFEAIIPRLDELVNIGINAIELMPIGQFPGNRNWGYDGVYPYAVQHSYGGPEALKKLVDACHQKGISVFLDVIYNHIGPEGNYFAQFGPYFSEKYHMPWGDAMNFDGEWSDGVKDFFSGNVIYWLEKFHLDGLRLDAIHTIYDDSAFNFWEITFNKVKALEKKSGRRFCMIAESDLNSPRVIQPPQQGGYGFDAQWLDDFHHALYTLLDEKGRKRYEDYGKMKQLAKAYTDGFVLSGDWVKFRKKKFGSSSAGVAGDRFVAFNQNHDQVGNRVKGERLPMLVDMERLKIAAAAVLLSPYVPMLFMGEEYGEDNPFYFFVSHSDEQLVNAVREGRKKDFSAFAGEGEFPDPQDENTFNRSKIKWDKRHHGKYHLMLRWHQALIALRKKYAALRDFNKNNIKATPIGEEALILQRGDIYCMFNFSSSAANTGIVNTEFELLLFSKEPQWMNAGEHSDPSPGKLTPLSVTVYRQLQ